MKPKPRQLSKPGLSIVDANKGRLITFQDDVLDIKRQIEREWPGLVSCFFDEDPSQECWVIVEHCKDGTDSVMFTTDFLSQATIDKIHRADQASRSYVDPNKAYEDMDREEEREKNHSLSEAIGEAGERLFLALRKDGVIHAPRVYLSDSGERMRGVT
jgi:hypothetical protein